MNPLISKCHDTGWYAKKGQPDQKIYPVQLMPLDDLWLCVKPAHQLYNKPFLENLKTDIRNDGLVFPVLCVEVTREELLQRKQRHGKSLSDLPFDINEDKDYKKDKQAYLNIKHFVIWGGCQRCYAAKALGYTHIDCAMIPTLNEAHSLQALHRRPFRERYYSRMPISEKNRVK